MKPSVETSILSQTARLRQARGAQVLAARGALSGLVLVLATLLGGCLPSQTIVLEPLTPLGKITTISIREANQSLPEASSSPEHTKPGTEPGTESGADPVHASDKHQVRVDPKLAETFASTLNKEIIRRTNLQVISSSEDAPLTLEYRFALHDRGDLGVRLISGAVGLLGSPFYGLGDGNVAVEAVYLDACGQVRGRVIQSVPLSGVFGSSEESFRIAAEEIAELTKVHFNPPSRTMPHSLLNEPAPSLGVPHE